MGLDLPRVGVEGHEEGGERTLLTREGDHHEFEIGAEKGEVPRLLPLESMAVAPLIEDPGLELLHLPFLPEHPSLGGDRVLRLSFDLFGERWGGSPHASLDGLEHDEGEERSGHEHRHERKAVVSQSHHFFDLHSSASFKGAPNQSSTAPFLGSLPQAVSRCLLPVLCAANAIRFRDSQGVRPAGAITSPLAPKSGRMGPSARYVGQRNITRYRKRTLLSPFGCRG